MNGRVPPRHGDPSGATATSSPALADLHGGNYRDLTRDEDGPARSSDRRRGAHDGRRACGPTVPSAAATAGNDDRARSVSTKQRPHLTGAVMDDGRGYGSAAAERPIPVIDLVDDADRAGPGGRRKRPPQRDEGDDDGAACHLPPHRRKRRPSDEADGGHPRRPARTACHLHLPGRTTEDGARITFGLLPLIHLLLRDENDGRTLTCEGSASSSRRKLLAPVELIGDGAVPFNHQPLHYLQSDNWSCGYRNVQMLLSALLPTIQSMFPRVPTVREMQTTMEALWRRGYDRPNARHHNFALVGKQSWIGTVEVWSYLSFRRVDAIIVQFIKTAANRALLGKFIWAYFRRACGEFGCACHGRNPSRGGNGNNSSGGTGLASPILYSAEYAAQLLRTISDPGYRGSDGAPTRRCECTLPPLYLQWEGHSVTVVGIRKIGNDGPNGPSSPSSFNLLIFCPQKIKLPLQGKDMMATELARRQSANGGRTAASSQRCEKFVNGLIEHPCYKLLEKDCQVLLSTGRIIDEEESLRRKSCTKNVGFLDAVA